MAKCSKLYERAQRNQENYRFSDALRLAECFGFREVKRKRGGSHVIYRRDGVDRLLNFQSEGGEVKAYQLRQLLDAVDDFGLELE